MPDKILLGDCLELMPSIPDKSIDMILCDLPYGTTACKWDVIIPFEPLWKEYNRIIKDNGAIVLTVSQPFTSQIIHSNIKNFKYEWIWVKNAGSNFATTKYQPMKEHESVLIFGNNTGLIKYNPIKQIRAPSGSARQKTPLTFNRKQKHEGGDVYNDIGINNISKKMISVDRCPSSVQYFSRERGLHPTQKPVALFEYFIKTYTNEGETVLDNCAGSFTTAIACINTKRNYICMEKEEKYFDIGEKRIKNHKAQLKLF